MADRNSNVAWFAAVCSNYGKMAKCFLSKARQRVRIKPEFGLSLGEEEGKFAGYHYV